MTSAAFDTLQAVHEIEAAGLELSQAEAIAKVIQRRGADLATKTDVSTLQSSIAGVEAGIVRLEKAISQLRNGFVTGLVALLVAILATALLPS
ncbi:hypothetical protein [Candidatus Foliamicus sp.]